MTTHDLFVAAAYAAATVGIGGLVAWMLVDHRSRRRELAELEASGVRRRSDRTGETA
jgi:heme exporter protein D